MRLGAHPPRTTLAQEGARLFRAIQDRLVELEVGQQLELGGSLADSESTWESLPAWMRDVFCQVWKEIHDSRNSL